MPEIKDPAIPTSGLEANDRALVLRGTGAAEMLRKVILRAAATRDVGQTAGTVAAGDDERFATAGLPAGGTEGQVLTRNGEGAAVWDDAAGGVADIGAVVAGLEARTGADRLSVAAIDGAEIRSTILTLAGDPDLLAAHDRRALRLTDATPVLSILTQASEAYPADFHCIGSSASAATVTADPGVTLNGVSAGSVAVGTEASGNMFALRRVAPDTWLCHTGIPDIEAEIDAHLDAVSDPIGEASHWDWATGAEGVQLTTALNRSLSTPRAVTPTVSGGFDIVAFDWPADGIDRSLVVTATIVNPVEVRIAPLPAEMAATGGDFPFILQFHNDSASLRPIALGVGNGATIAYAAWQEGAEDRAEVPAGKTIRLQGKMMGGMGPAGGYLGLVSVDYVTP